MPSVSKKQHNFMAAIAHNPAFAKKVGVPQSVGEDFNKADKGKKFGLGGGVGISRGGAEQINKQQTRRGSIYGQQKEVPNVNLNRYIGKKEGGAVKHDDIKEDKVLIKRAFGMHDKQLHESKKTDLTKLNKGGVMKAKETMGPRTMSMDVEKGSNKLLKHGESGVQKRGHTKGKNLGDTGPKKGIETEKNIKTFSKGGSASSRGDGIASKGKTRGKMC
jgi:hypothetical protein